MEPRRWTARTDVFERATATSLIVLPSEGPGLKLNGPAAAIWERTHEGGSSEEIATDVAAVFDEDPVEILPFVIDTLETLRDARLVDCSEFADVGRLAPIPSSAVDVHRTPGSS